MKAKNIMQKEIRVVDEKKGVVQITLPDERWYAWPSENKTTGLPEYVFDPSVTWITSYYPKGIELIKWIANKGFDEAERIKIEAGDKGSLVHRAAEMLLKGETLRLDTKIADHEMTANEWYCIWSFSKWYVEAGNPKVIAIEQTVRNKEHGYSGTLDMIYEAPDGLHLLDIKTSKSIWPSHELQVSALKAAYEAETKKPIVALEILQIGYERNKAGYKLTPVDDQFDIFLAVKKIWAKENQNVNPPQREYPLNITIKQQPKNGVQLQPNTKASK